MATLQLVLTGVGPERKHAIQIQSSSPDHAGFGPEREGIITIESQDGGMLGEYNSVTERVI